jgi:branched-chain amino acid transport system ATP-binding protein
LTKSFGGLIAVNDVSFRIRKGEMMGLIGPNGAGKTTLFNLITGFRSLPDKGTVRFKDEVITKLKPYQIVNKGIARTFQLVKPLAGMTVFDNLRVPSFCKRMAKKKGSSKIDEVAELVGLSDKKSELAKNLPHGDLKRLEIARALITEPELIMMDEPFAGLNLKETDDLLSVIVKLNKDGLAVFIIEHKLRALMKIVQKVMVLHHGIKIAENTPEMISKDQQVVEAYMGKGGGFSTT